jgi:hypothetical protein
MLTDHHDQSPQPVGDVGPCIDQFSTQSLEKVSNPVANIRINKSRAKLSPVGPIYVG